MYKMYKNKDKKKTTSIDLRLFTLLDNTKYDDDQFKILTAVVFSVNYLYNSYLCIGHYRDL